MEKFTLEDAQKAIDMLYHKIHEGCGNRPCVINERPGQHTNGGCKCSPHRIIRDLFDIAEAIADRAGNSWEKGKSDA